MTDDVKKDLVDYLRTGREALLWKLDGASELDVRRPLVPTGTNLLGLVKHVAITSAGYFAGVFDRPLPEVDHWFDDAEDGADMWARADESRADVLALWQRCWAHADATIAELPIDATGHVAWWPPERSTITLHRALVHVATEVHRHAGHADIVRELVDGQAGLKPDSSNLPSTDADYWRREHDTIAAAAREAAG